jgi:hypothetical protein
MSDTGRGRIQGLPATKLGIVDVHTSIAGMEHLEGYPPGFVGGITTTTSIIFARHGSGSVSLGASGEAHGGIGFNLWWLVLILAILTCCGAAGAYFYTRLKERQKMRRKLRRASLYESPKGSDSEYTELSGKSSAVGDSDDEQSAEEEDGAQDYAERGLEVRNSDPFEGQPLDLVTVTPQGLAVTPIGSTPPNGVPILDAKLDMHAFQAPQPLPQGGMDLVQVTASGLNVTPLNGPAPPGVPFLDPAVARSQASVGTQQSMGTGPTMGMQQVAALSTQVLGPQQVATLGTQTMGGGMYNAPGSPAPMGTSRSVASASRPSPVPTQHFPAPTPTQQMAFSEEFDLVTVTSDGLQVTPLNGSPPPIGLPILETEMRPQAYGTVPSFPGQAAAGMVGMPTTIFR